MVEGTKVEMSWSILLVFAAEHVELDVIDLTDD